MRVICNSSPLILFSRAGLLDILKSLFDNLVISEEVFNEVTRKGKLGEKIIKDADWITTVEVPKEDPIRKYYEKRFISSADPSVIALAKKENADLVLADDKKMRNALKQEGLIVTGCVGILIQAKKKKLIINVKKPLDRLLKEGLRLSRDIYEDTIKLAGE